MSDDFTGRYEINVAALLALVDEQRQARGTSWLALATALGVPPSSFTRMATGTAPAGNVFVTLMVWLLSRGVQPKQYIRSADRLTGNHRSTERPTQVRAP
jgi:hypothetical protein